MQLTMGASGSYLNFLMIALAWLSVSSEDNSTKPASRTIGIECLVCGHGNRVGQAWTIVSTNFGMFTCEGLSGAGLLGHIPDCEHAQDIAQFMCDCTNDGADGGSQGNNNELPHSVCALCGDSDKVVTLHGAVVTIPGEEDRTCDDYAAYARAGMISESQCGLLQEYTTEACGCSDGDTSLPIDPPEEDEVEPVSQTCSVCGPGMAVGNPDGVVSVPNQPDRICSSLQVAGENGSIGEEACDFLRPYVLASCMCQFEHNFIPEPEPEPEPETTPPEVYHCNICGDGMMATNLDGIVFIPTQPDRSCNQLIMAAEAGNITETQCGLLKGFTRGPCGCVATNTFEPSTIPSDMPSIMPSAGYEPTPSPAPSPYFTAKAGCFDNLQEIYDIESALHNSNQRRKYILCPETTFDMGVVADDDTIQSGQPFIMLRPNVIYQCGFDGSRQNNCVLKGGDFGVVSYYGVFDGVYETVSNVRLQGLSFESQRLFGVVLEAAGDITFVDCAFRTHANKAPVFLQWRGEGPLEARATEEGRKLRKTTGPSMSQKFYSRMRSLDYITGYNEFESHRKLQTESGMYNHVVTFQDCMFTDNMIIQDMAFPGLIENTFGSEVNIINCLFQNNHYGEQNNAAPSGYAIRSFGPLNIENSCFISNTFLNYGPIQVFGARYTSKGNYVESFQDNLACSFIALFTPQDEMTDRDPTCVPFEELTCGFTSAPTQSPTEIPITLAETTKEPVATPPENSRAPERASILLTAAAIIISSLVSCS